MATKAMYFVCSTAHYTHFSVNMPNLQKLRLFCDWNSSVKANLIKWVFKNKIKFLTFTYCVATISFRIFQLQLCHIPVKTILYINTLVKSICNLTPVRTNYIISILAGSQKFMPFPFFFQHVLIF